MGARRTSSGHKAVDDYHLSRYDQDDGESVSKSAVVEDDDFLSDDDPYSAHEPILRLPGAPSRPAAKSIGSSRVRLPPNRIMRYLCFALAGGILLLMLSLFQAAVSSKNAVLVMNEEKKNNPEPEPGQPIWNVFPVLQRYGGGLRALVDLKDNEPEFPREGNSSLPDLRPTRERMHRVPPSQAYDPYPDYKSPDYTKEFGKINECFLDEQKTIKSPKIHHYSGVPFGMPDNAYGDRELLGLNNSVCFDRYARYGPYGYGYSKEKGGSDIGLGGDREGADNMWEDQQQIDFTKIDWAKAQRRCAQQNAHRFKLPEKAPVSNMPGLNSGERDGNLPSWMQPFESANNSALEARDETPIQSDSAEPPTGPHKIARQAVVLRGMTGFPFTEESKMHLRALVNELSLSSGGEFDVHLLVQSRDNDVPIFADDDTYQRILRENIPEEFRGLTTLWNENQMLTLYSGVKDEYEREGFPELYGVYRSAHFALQHFSRLHPEYEHLWNFEMDIRYIGNYYEFFTNVAKWSAKQPRKGLWERNHRFYIPSVHGTWDEFSHMVRIESEKKDTEDELSKWAKTGAENGAEQPEPYIDEPVWGPQYPKDDDNAAPFPDDPKPPTTRQKDKSEWGVGEEADLILFHPLFDPVRTNWMIAHDCNGYNRKEKGDPPRRVAIVAAGRLSRRLLDRMHREVALRKHTCFPEMFPPTVALHHGLKAVYAPHPVYTDRDWPMKFLASTLNPGPKGVAGRHRQSVFGDCCQHNLGGMTWHYNAYFPRQLIRRWWGLRDEDTQVGGEQEERDGEGRMCLPPTLLHPVKSFDE